MALLSSNKPQRTCSLQYFQIFSFFSKDAFPIETKVGGNVHWNQDGPLPCLQSFCSNWKAFKAMTKTSDPTDDCAKRGVFCWF